MNKYSNPTQKQEESEKTLNSREEVPAICPPPSPPQWDVIPMICRGQAGQICPNCGSKNVGDIEYGLPAPYKDKERFSSKFFNKQKRPVMNGGCCISPYSPRFFCADCRQEFGCQMAPEDYINPSNVSPVSKNHEPKDKPESTVSLKLHEHCCIFAFPTASMAIENLVIKEVENYGGEGEGFSWNDGMRALVHCVNCGALFLRHKVKFLAMSYDMDEITYVDYFAFPGREEAFDYNEKYKKDGLLLRSQFKGLKIWFNGREWQWNKK
jgi:ribosomal protein L32